jgi:acyl-CoA reductase-like NAD-dependent aldehyde dehydrogenase
MDNGKPKAIARVADVALAADLFHYMAGWTTKLEGATIPLSGVTAPGTQFHAYTLREPVGVVGQIIPWNFPLLMAAWKLGPVLACGCTVVLKPAEQTPLSALRLGALIQEAGLPAGVLNIVTGFGDAGAAIAAHPGVDRVAFTGSTDVGKKIVQAAAGNLKKVTLEFGGKSPQIVLDDADLEVAIPGAANAIFFNHGQCCCAGSRLYVEAGVFDDVVAGVAEEARKIRLGRGLDPDTQMGPLVSDEQLARVCGYLDSGIEEGARAIAGGRRSGDRGYFVEPTVLVDTTPDMKVVREEIFGPVVSAMPFTDHEHVLRRPTRPTSASRPGSGRAMSATPTASPPSCSPARCGSTPTTSSTRRCRSAASRSPAGAGRWVARYSTTTSRPRPSGSSCERRGIMKTAVVRDFAQPLSIEEVPTPSPRRGRCSSASRPRGSATPTSTPPTATGRSSRRCP